MKNIIEKLAEAIRGGDSKGIIKAGIKFGEKPGKLINDLIDKTFDILEGKNNHPNAY